MSVVLCMCICRISLSSEGNALYPVLCVSSFHCGNIVIIAELNNKSDKFKCYNCDLAT